MDAGLILLILVGFAIALAIVTGGYAARLLMQAAERPPKARSSGDDR